MLSTADQLIATFRSNATLKYNLTSLPMDYLCLKTNLLFIHDFFIASFDFDKRCLHDEIHFFLQCDYRFHDLSLRHAYLSIYYTCCFWNHYTALMIDALSSALVATARITISDRRAAIKTYIAFAETNSILWLEIASQKIKK